MTLARATKPGHRRPFPGIVRRRRSSGGQPPDRSRAAQFFASSAMPHKFSRAQRPARRARIFGRQTLTSPFAASAAQNGDSFSPRMAAPEKNRSLVLAAHPNLAVPAKWMKRLAPQMKVIVLAHGIDVWEPLSSSRHAALLAADLVLAPSSYTAQKLAEVQSVPPHKIRKLPWPLNSDVLNMAAAPANLPLPKNFPPSPVVILTVGRWAASERYKGADELIRAVAQLRQAIPDFEPRRRRRWRRSSAPEKDRRQT